MNMKDIVENSIIEQWAKHFARAPLQLNKPHQADAELVELPDGHYLAITIDTVAEEITTGLYQEPYTMGWVTVMAVVSDLAAVGADPIGLVVSSSLEPSRDKKFVFEIARGIQDACVELGIYILGGDVNTTPSISLSGCAVGLVRKDKVMMRSGLKAGDVVFCSGRIGSGNALGLARLAGLPAQVFPEELYRPRARIRQGQLIREFASACMDSSDGLFTTLDQLMRINDLGFEINCEWEKILAPEAYRLCRDTSTPFWAMAAGPHGEFELVFTVSAEKVDEFGKAANSRGFSPIKLGRVQSSPKLTLVTSSKQHLDIDMAPLRNLLYTTEGDMGRYMEEFREYGKKWRLT